MSEWKQGLSGLYATRETPTTQDHQLNELLAPQEEGTENQRPFPKDVAFGRPPARHPAGLARQVLCRAQTIINSEPARQAWHRERRQGRLGTHGFGQLHN